MTGSEMGRHPVYSYMDDRYSKEIVKLHEHHQVGVMGNFTIVRLLCFILCNNGDEIGDSENDKDDISFCDFLSSFLVLLVLLLLLLISPFCFAMNDSLNETDRTNSWGYFESLYFDGNFLFFFQFLYWSCICFLLLDARSPSSFTWVSQKDLKLKLIGSFKEKNSSNNMASS